VSLYLSIFTSTSGTDVFLLIIYIFCLPKKNKKSRISTLQALLLSHQNAPSIGHCDGAQWLEI